MPTLDVDTVIPVTMVIDIERGKPDPFAKAWLDRCVGYCIGAVQGGRVMLEGVNFGYLDSHWNNLKYAELNFVRKRGKILR